MYSLIGADQSKNIGGKMMNNAQKREEMVEVFAAVYASLAVFTRVSPLFAGFIHPHRGLARCLASLFSTPECGQSAMVPPSLGRPAF